MSFPSFPALMKYHRNGCPPPPPPPKFGGVVNARSGWRTGTACGPRDRDPECRPGVRRGRAVPGAAGVRPDRPDPQPGGAADGPIGRREYHAPGARGRKVRLRCRESQQFTVVHAGEPVLTHGRTRINLVLRATGNSTRDWNLTIIGRDDAIDGNAQDSRVSFGPIRVQGPPPGVTLSPSAATVTRALSTTEGGNATYNVQSGQ